ncbi:MAG TPA: hypothetical protein VF984_09275 [Actinomycetota bacterium]
MARWEGFEKCPGCGFDLVTGEGQRSCAWGDCPYLPGELDVFCPDCRFNFFTMEGNPPCEDPVSCEHGEEARSHIENLRRWAEQRQIVP